MHDLPNEKNGYREKATDIEIQQSHSYEITEQTNYQPSASQNYQQEQIYEDPVPVIVLRIPGPQKYALHLQALLQQYLEIRAAQYIKALEDQERRGHLHHPQHYLAQQQQHMQYMSVIAVNPMYHHPYYQHQQLQQQQQQTQHGFQQYYQVNHGNNYQVPAGEQSYYTQAQPAVQEYHHQSTQPQHQQQQEYPTSYINFVTPTYEQGDLHHQSQQQQPQVQVHHHEPQQQHDDRLETSENYPSEKHTQVIFKKKKNRVHRPSISYHQSAPIVVPDHPHHQQQEEVYQHQPEPMHHSHTPEHQLYAYTNNFNEHQDETEVVAVTQRSQSPINYHILQSTLAPTHEELHERHNPKRMAPFTKEQFEKARRIMTKSKRNRGSVRQENQAVKSVEAPKS